MLVIVLYVSGISGIRVYCIGCWVGTVSQYVLPHGQMLFSVASAIVAGYVIEVGHELIFVQVRSATVSRMAS